MATCLETIFLLRDFFAAPWRGVLKTEEAVRGAFGGGSVFGGVSEEGKSVGGSS